MSKPLTSSTRSLLHRDQASFEDGDRSILQDFRQSKLVSFAVSSSPENLKTPAWIDRNSFEQSHYRTPIAPPRMFVDSNKSFISPIPHRDEVPPTIHKSPMYVSPRRQTPHQEDILESELQRANELERQLEHTRIEASNASLASKQLLLLRSQVASKESELELSRRQELQLRNEKLVYEERIAKLEASLSVLEARLEASMRREAALEGIANNLEIVQQSMHETPSPPPAIIQQQQDPQLVQRLEHMNVLLQDVEESRQQAEYARVATEKQMIEMETRLEYCAAGKKQLQSRFDQLTHEYQALQAENQELMRVSDHLRFNVEEMKQDRIRRAERVQTSQNDHLTRKLLSVICDAIPNLSVLVGLVENELQPNRALLSTTQLLELENTALVVSKDLDALLGTCTTLAQRAKTVKMQVVERSAVMENQQVPLRTRTWSRDHYRQPAQVDLNESKCGVQ